jgi:hypothetical protein
VAEWRDIEIHRCLCVFFKDDKVEVVVLLSGAELKRFDGLFSSSD